MSRRILSTVMVVVGWSWVGSTPTAAEGQPTREASFSWSYLSGWGSRESGADLTAVLEMRRRMVLQGVTDHLNAALDLPQQIRITLPPCGAADAYYEPAGRRIVVCSELLALAFSAEEREQEAFSRLVGVDSATVMMWDRVANELEYMILHEVGHAIIQLGDLPVVGNEEDAADQFAVFLPSHAENAKWLFRVAGGAGHLLGRFAENEVFTQETAGYEHPMSQQRMANIACWIFGHLQLRPDLWPRALAEGFSDFAVQNVPAARLGRCVAEYMRLEEAWSRLAEPFLR